MGTTVKGYPFPEPSDPLGDADLHIKALAEAITSKLRAATEVFDFVNVTVMTRVVAIPTGIYSSGPRIVATTHNALFNCAVSGVSATGFTLTVRHLPGTDTTVTVPVTYLAVPQ